jgi:DNA-binding transcriptional MerR regulator|nr:hypothetical protein [uncultured Bacteroides sp.]
MKDSSKSKEEVAEIIKRIMKKLEKHEITIEEAKRLSKKAKEEIDKNVDELESLISKAIDAYKKECDERMNEFDEPCKNATIIGQKYVHLYNKERLLAKYDMFSGEIILS